MRASAKATSRFILASKTGTEFYDIENCCESVNHWVRGGCLYGIMPANGMVYLPPHNCSCYPEAKLFGLWALKARQPGLVFLGRIEAEHAVVTERDHAGHGPGILRRPQGRARR